MEYKLLQWYPSLPSDWEKGMLVGQGDRGSVSKYSPCHAKYSDFPSSRLSVYEVQNHPEFWEKVIPKESIIKTTDGLELIAGDRYYVPQVEGKLRRLTGSEVTFHIQSEMPEDETKRFAKKENAHAYIENHIGKRKVIQYLMKLI